MWSTAVAINSPPNFHGAHKDTFSAHSSKIRRGFSALALCVHVIFSLFCCAKEVDESVLSLWVENCQRLWRGSGSFLMKIGFYGKRALGVTAWRKKIWYYEKSVSVKWHFAPRFTHTARSACNPLDGCTLILHTRRKQPERYSSFCVRRDDMTDSCIVDIVLYNVH